MDQKAKEILFNTYWSPEGWNENTHTDARDFAYAKVHGVMFDPLTISHTELFTALSTVMENVPLNTITDAFMGSFSHQRPDWRSALGSYMNVQRLLPSFLNLDLRGELSPGIDLNILNFQRLKWGGLDLHNPVYNLLDLQCLSRDVIPEPDKEDRETFEQVLATIKTSRPNDTPTKLAERLKDLLHTSRQEMRSMIEAMACAGILQPSNFDRPLPEKIDFFFAMFWRGEDGYKEERVKELFSTK